MEEGKLLAPTKALDRFVPRPGEFAQPGQKVRDELARFGFTAAGLHLLVPSGTGSEAVEGQALAMIPGAPPALRGVMNLRGNPVPVFDLTVVLNLEQRQRPKNTVLVLGKGTAAVGILVDGLPRPLRGLRLTELPEAVPAPLAPFVHGAWAEPGALWLEFDHDALFSLLGGAVSPSFGSH